MHTKTSFGKSWHALAVALGLLTMAATAFGATTLYFDDFESYPAQNPAPSPLTNGPAGGEWVYVDENPPIDVNEQQILNGSSLGAAFYSRVWASATNNARLTNAISLAGLPAGTTHTFRLSFVVATDTLAVGRFIPFDYEITSSAGTLTLLTGHNLDDSQTFSSLSGTGIAVSETKGKSPDRRFEFVFQGDDLTASDQIQFSIRRQTNNGAATPALTFFLDDVRLAVDDSTPPTVQSVEPLLTLQHVRVTFSEPVDAASASDPNHYSFSGNTLSVQSATVFSPSVVDLYTTEMAPSSSHTLQVAGVLGQTGVSLVATQLNFTALALAISPVRYDAGTTASMPSGAPDPISPEAGFWQNVPNTQVGMTAGPAADDGSGFNAWRITDSNAAKNGGTIMYSLPLDTESINLSRSNGWRIVVRSRVVDNFGSTATDHAVIYADGEARTRFGFFWGVNAANNLYVTPLGGTTVELTSSVDETIAYHTQMMVYNPATKSAAIYFDGRLVIPNYVGQVITVPRGFSFGCASSAAKGEMNYNLVQLDVVGATQPVATLNPEGGSYGVGQKVTFTAAFSPFVNAYQWLSNGVILAGATNTSYTTDFISSENDGDQYQLRALSALGNVDTAPAILTVTQDTNPPVIVASQGSALRDRVTLTFSEPVLENYATDINNYSWLNSEVTNASARLLDPLTVELRGGPFEANSNYTIRVSNIRDTSNLSIASDSPATFVFPELTSAAHYDAGNTTSAPSGPPDPITPEGGNWTAQISTNVDISTNAVFDDLGTGFHAWQIRDGTTATGQFASYGQQLATNVQNNARQFGWVLTLRSRLVESFITNSAMFALYEDYHFDRYGLIFGLDENNDLLVGTSTSTGFTTNILTAGGTGLDAYHLHQLVFDPQTESASYYFDGNLVAWQFPVSRPANSVAELMWGARASAALGTMNYNFVDFSIVDGPYANVAINGNNADISFRGVLESASQLGNPTQWMPIATNLTGGAVSLPAQTQQYFRARLP